MNTPVLAAASLAIAATANLALAAPPATTSVHKCSGINGVPVYQEMPCATGRELRDLTENPSNVSIIPFRFPAEAKPAPRQRAERETNTPRRGREPRAKSLPAEGPGFDASERRHLREGMSDSEVRARLGAPDMTSGKGGKVRWSYLPVAADPATITTVRIENGRVVAIDRTVVR